MVPNTYTTLVCDREPDKNTILIIGVADFRLQANQGDTKIEKRRSKAFSEWS